MIAMAITDDLRKTLSDPTPFYFAAGTADLALQQAKKVPALVEQLRVEAPARIEAVRTADPKAVQEKASARVRETQEKATARVKETQETFQTKMTEIIGTLDTDLKKLGETAQDLALRGVGVAAEYAVKARETYEKVAEHGEQAVKAWRGEAAEEIEELAVAVEPNPEPVEVELKEEETPAAPTAASAKKPAAKKAPARKTAPAAKKTTPPAK
jgi:heparin binding hemagglutinin HbhA